MSKPENVIQKKKQGRKQRVEELRNESNELKERINGNPAVIKAIRKLEERLELLEDQVLD